MRVGTPSRRISIPKAWPRGICNCRDFDTYLPKRKRTVRHARRIRTVSGAYFDNYLFVSLDVRKQRWLQINSTVGVRKLVMSDGMPVPVPSGVVESLILSTDDDGILHSEKLLQIGNKVQSRMRAICRSTRYP